MSLATTRADAQAPWLPLLDWWFGPAGTAAEVSAARHQLWFGYRAWQDREAAERFAPLVDEALRGGLQSWADSPHGWLALILLLDQLPRMIYRGTAQAFAGDGRAQQVAFEGLAAGREQALEPIRQVFIYLVLEHHECLQSQDMAVSRFRALREDAVAGQRRPFTGFLDFAQQHRSVILQFGRFPHRNAILGRVSSEAEQAYLAEPGAGF